MLIFAEKHFQQTKRATFFWLKTKTCDFGLIPVSLTCWITLSKLLKLSESVFPEKSNQLMSVKHCCKLLSARPSLSVWSPSTSHRIFHLGHSLLVSPWTFYVTAIHFPNCIIYNLETKKGSLNTHLIMLTPFVVLRMLLHAWGWIWDPEWGILWPDAVFSESLLSSLLLLLQQLHWVVFIARICHHFFFPSILGTVSSISWFSNS